MDIISLLIRALWVSAIIFLVFWTGRWIYRKIRPEVFSFFYLLSVEKNKGMWVVRIEAPEDNFELNICILDGSTLIFEKQFSLNEGVNRVTVKSPGLKPDNNAVIRISSSDQKLERKV